MDIEHAAADIDGAPNLRIALAVARTLRLLIQKPGDQGEGEDSCAGNRNGQRRRLPFRGRHAASILRLRVKDRGDWGRIIGR